MGFLRSSVAIALVGVFGLVSPSSAESGGNISPVVEGVCVGYTPHGDLPCRLRTEDNGRVVHISDGYNLISYVRGWIPNTYRMWVNDKEDSMVYCTLNQNNFNCLFSVNFYEN